MSKQQSDSRTLTQLQERLSELEKGSRETTMLDEAYNKLQQSSQTGEDKTIFNQEETAAFEVGEKEGEEIEELEELISKLVSRKHSTVTACS